ncbi:hypothetical protein IT575_14995 [bacterium]|nr:hypothetical protein [bacterium]
MAGLLRKLAGLVVEFPDEQKGSGSAAAKDSADQTETDPLAAIEAIRADLESSTSLDTRKLDAEADKLAEHASESLAADGTVKTDKAAAGLPTAASALPQIRLPIVLSISQVYEKAELPAVPGGFDLVKVAQMLEDPEITGLPLDVRARSVKMAVKAAGGEMKEVLADAARRDQALEVYLNYLSGKVDEIHSQVESQNATLEQEIQDFITARRAIIESNKAKLEAARQALHSYSDSKQAEEERLYQLVAPFVAPGENPVVVSSALPQSGADRKE